VEFYGQLLTAFGEFDVDYLVLNIYFEKEADELFNDLRPLYTQLTGVQSFVDPIIKQTVGTFDNSSIKSFLRTYFMGVINLSEADWEMENINRNPFIQRLSDWLSDNISSETSPQLIEEVLLHYTKLWNVFFCNPYQYVKGLVLFHKFIEQYKKLDIKKINIDLNSCILNTRYVISELIPQIYHSPLTDIDCGSFYLADSQTPFPVNAQVYLKKNEEFHKILNDDKGLFIDLTNESWISLIERFCSGPERIRFIYINELQRRKALGIVPGAKEIDLFVCEKGVWDFGDPIISKMLGEVMRDNYIFFY
jgi:hypothetical protein